MSMFANMTLITATVFKQGAAHLTWPGIGQDVDTLDVSLYVLSLPSRLVTHTAVKCFILRHCTHLTDVGVKFIMLQKHCNRILFWYPSIKSKKNHMGLFYNIIHNMTIKRENIINPSINNLNGPMIDSFCVFACAFDNHDAFWEKRHTSDRWRGQSQCDNSQYVSRPPASAHWACHTHRRNKFCPPSGDTRCWCRNLIGCASEKLKYKWNVVLSQPLIWHGMYSRTISVGICQRIKSCVFWHVSYIQSGF